MAKLTTITIGDERIDVDVDAAGKFSATYQEEDYRTTTLDELTKKLEQAHRDAKQAIRVPVTVLGLIPNVEKNRYGKPDPFTRGRGVVHGVLRGKHGRLSVYLLTSDDGKKFQVETYSSAPTICARLTDVQVARYLELAEAKDAAVAALETFEEVAALDVAAVTAGKAVSRG